MEANCRDAQGGGDIHLENLGRLNTVALDKAGTLTTGHFAVNRVIGFEGTPEDQVLRMAAAVEEQSSHPLAAAIVKTTRERNITFPSATEIENLAGKGIQAHVEGPCRRRRSIDLGKLFFAIGLSRASARIIRQNLMIALGVIGLLLIASGFGVIPLSSAVVLHEGSTIVVVLNALRLLAWKKRLDD